jgi:secretory lipase
MVASASLAGADAPQPQWKCTTGARGGLQPTPPPDDPFYTPPDPLPEGAPGTIIRSQPVCVADLQIPVPYAAWLIMYLSTGAEDVDGVPSELDATPMAVTALIVAPLTPSPAGNRPLLSIHPPQDSNSTLQAPSYTTRYGNTWENVGWQWGLAQGWTIIMPDYEGPSSAFGAGPLEGHAILDGVRATENFSATDGLDGAATPVGFWGYSGGALATMWASELAPTYAPELNIVAVAAGGVPADLVTVFNRINDGYLGNGLVFAAAVGVDAAYPNLVHLADVLNDAGDALAQHMRDTGDSSYPSSYPPQHVEMYTNCECNPINYPEDFPGIAQVVATVELGRHVPAAPLFIYHSWNDELIPVAGVQDLVQTYCDGGATVDFRVMAGTEHITEAVVGGPEAFAYLSSRFDGLPAVNTCGLPDNGGVTPPAPVPPVPLPPDLPV